MNPDEQLLPPHLPSAANAMWSFDQPPSVGVVRPLDNSEISGGGEHRQPPSTGAVRPSDNSEISGGGDHGQPPSTGDVRLFDNSPLSGGGGNHYATGQPPSTGAVRPLENSQTANPISDSRGKSLMAPKINLRMINPNAFQRENIEN